MRSKILKFGFIFLGLFPVLAFGHFLVFPGETRCMLIDGSKFQKDSDLYVEPGTGPSKLIGIRKLISESKSRVVTFWGVRTSKPKFIFCNSASAYEKYAGRGAGPACSFMKLKGYVIISNEGLQTDIISHELCHIELYTRIGFWENTFEIPAWFHEGLAMQVDQRKDFSTDSLRHYSSNFTRMPDIKKLITNRDFNAGTPDEVITHYAAAKYVVGQWYSRDKLDRFVEEIRKGKGFENAFGN